MVHMMGMKVVAMLGKDLDAMMELLRVYHVAVHWVDEKENYSVAVTVYLKGRRSVAKWDDL